MTSTERYVHCERNFIVYTLRFANTCVCGYRWYVLAMYRITKSQSNCHGSMTSTSFVFIVWHTQEKKNLESDVERVEKRIAGRKIVSKLIYFPFISYQIWWSMRSQHESMNIGWIGAQNTSMIWFELEFSWQLFCYIRSEAVTWAERNILKQISFPAATNNGNWFDFLTQFSCYSIIKYAFKIGYAMSFMEAKGNTHWFSYLIWDTKNKGWVNRAPVEFRRLCYLVYMERWIVSNIKHVIVRVRINRWGTLWKISSF